MASTDPADAVVDNEAVVVPSVVAKGKGSVGLYNQGATCYLNSLLQLLFHTTYFRSAVYKMTASGRDITNITTALQLVFYQMQVRDAAFTPKVLTDAFGWSGSDLFEQHDIHELVTLLRDSIEETMKGTPSEGAINRLFGGVSEKFFRCLDDSYTSRRTEDFYDLQLQVQGFSDLVESLKSTLAVEQLTGSNKYCVEEEGKKPVYKDAETGTRFVKFPPVLVCHLKRIDMDFESPTLEQKKINNPFSFPEVLDLREIESGDEATKREKPLEEGLEAGEAVYDLYGIIVHRGGVRSGHYFCYMRPWLSETSSWGDWIEFDDETARSVTRETAVDTNFGGYVTRTNHQGYRMQVLSPQNAYILSYVRRGHTDNVFYDERTDNIPADVKAEFDRVVGEEEEKRRVAEELARHCTLSIVSDRTIGDHVATSKFDIGVGREIPTECVVSVRKDAPWNDAMVSVGDALGCPPQNVRLWVCENRALQTYGQGWRVASQVNDEPSYLRTFNPRGDSGSVNEELAPYVPSTQSPAPWHLTVYAHIAAETAQHHLTNAAPYGNLQYSSSRQERNINIARESAVHRFHPEDPSPRMVVKLDKAYSVEAVRFRVHHGVRSNTGMPAAFSIKATVFAGQTPVAAKTVAVEISQAFLKVDFPLNGVAADYIIIERLAPAASHVPVPPFAVSKLHVTVPNAELEKFKEEPQLLLPSPRTNIMVQVKFFNPHADTLAFIGTCMLPAAENLRNSLPILCHRAGLPVATKGFAIFEERSPTDLIELALDAMPSDPTVTPGNYLRNGSIVVLQVDPATVPLCFQHQRADAFFRTCGDVRHMNIRSINAPAEIEAIVPMQGRWKFQRVADTIAKAVGADADYIRFFMSAAVRKPSPRDEPERSDSTATLAQVACVGDWPTNDLWYEVLPMKRAEQERIVAVKATLTDEKGTPVSDDAHVQFDLDSDATASDVIAGVLERAGVPFDRPYALLAIFDRAIRHLHAAAPDKANNERIHSLFVRHSDRSFEVRPYVAPAEDEVEYTVGIGQYGQSPLMHGSPFVTRLPEGATPQMALDHLLRITQVPEEELGEYKIMMFTHVALYFRDFDMLLTEYWRLTTFTQRPSLMLDCKRPKEKAGSRYVSQNTPALSINKRKTRTSS